jgi:phosphoribosylanthranilate isomerase
LAYIRELKAYSPAPVIRVLRVERLEDLVSVSGQQKDRPEDYLLLNSPGGTGLPFPWELLQSCRPVIPYFLAGGITLDNLGDAMAYRPDGLDVSSGVETRGLKDRSKSSVWYNGFGKAD